MADERIKLDENSRNIIAGIGSTSGEIIQARVDDTTKRLEVETQSSGAATDSVVAYSNTVKDGSGTNYVPLVDSNGYQLIRSLGDLVNVAYDYIALTYTGSNLTGIVYRISGASGTIVVTLTLGYDGSNNLSTVTKT